MNVVSRHFMMNLGNNFEDFDLRKFDFYVNHINKGVKKELLNIQDSLRI